MKTFGLIVQRNGYTVETLFPCMVKNSLADIGSRMKQSSYGKNINFKVKGVTQLSPQRLPAGCNTDRSDAINKTKNNSLI